MGGAALHALTVAVPCAALLVSACSRGAATAPDAGAPSPPPWSTTAERDAPEPRPGMLWIPPGVLLAGTPLDRLPRVADEEMGGEQVVMRGFYVDLYPYPNEAGAIPSTNIGLPEARALCEASGKRLCTELELERACKGPDNRTYEYGDVYTPGVCATGRERALIPNGFNTACTSAFGVHDLHGGAWSWTASSWRRDPAKLGLVATRGGNGTPGDLMGRCANGRAVKADGKREDLGVRCCAGEVNTFEVVLDVIRGEPLRFSQPEDIIAPRLLRLVPAEVIEAGHGGRPVDEFRVERLWTWHPLGNEELRIGGGCSRAGQKERARCGVVIARLRFDTATLLAWVAADYWQPAMGEADSPRELFLFGGDRNGAFRRRVSYAWGRIAVGEKERKKKKIGYDEPTF